jgi:hypothetical protein
LGHSADRRPEKEEVTRTRRTKKAPAVGQWSAEAGLYPFKVIVEENPHRKGGLYLRWWDPNLDPPNWRRESLKTEKLGKRLRAEDGSIDASVAQWASEQVMKKSQQLSGAVAAAAEAPTKKRITVGEIEALITDEKTGKYPHQSAFRSELVRAIRYAVSVWGADTFVDTIDNAKWTELARDRVTGLVGRGHVGARSAEITISRLITVMRWLRKQKHIPAGAAEIDDERTATRVAKWKVELLAFLRGLTHSKRDPQPSRPRHSQEEMLRLFAAAPKVDPRMFILLYVTAELRLGQTSRAMRSDLRLEKSEFGELHIFGAGHKGGEIVELTMGMRRTASTSISPAS